MNKLGGSYTHNCKPSLSHPVLCTNMYVVHTHPQSYSHTLSLNTTYRKTLMVDGFVLWLVFYIH